MLHVVFVKACFRSCKVRQVKMGINRPESTRPRVAKTRRESSGGGVTPSASSTKSSIPASRASLSDILASRSARAVSMTASKFPASSENQAVERGFCGLRHSRGQPAFRQRHIGLTTPVRRESSTTRTEIQGGIIPYHPHTHQVLIDVRGQMVISDDRCRADPACYRHQYVIVCQL